MHNGELAKSAKFHL